AGSLIRNGCTVIAMTSPVQVFQITTIGSATSLTVTPAANPVIPAGTKYAILLSDSLSVDGLAQDIAETFTMYQRYMSGFADVMNGTTDVTITINGAAVTVPGQKSLAKKGANNDITSLSGLTTALSISQGGTGAKNAADARTNLGLGSSATRNAYSTSGDMLSVGDFGFGTPVQAQPLTAAESANSFSWFYSSSAAGGFGGAGHEGKLTAKTNEGVNNFAFTWYANSSSKIVGVVCKQTKSSGADVNAEVWRSKMWTNQNTTVDSSGFIKSASPIVKVYSDGKYQLNDESEGCTVSRLSVGEYLIEGCMGMNSDAAWGGIDGGFDIPKDRNGQALIWLDYEVNADGSVLVKTFHREYPTAPAFARNSVEGYVDGQPADIPADQFVSVRVEMPQNSIWNQRAAMAEVPDPSAD
ncbi:phage tail protein, partial [Enterobacter hormaechei]|uniref:phage tail fiber protein n=1 Tax=Enterobacter hormaechei TaxID=158836 RepID=UPI001C63D1A6